MNNAGELSLDRCTRTRCSRCDIGYIISNYITPLMQCLTNDIKDYNMGLLTTKCLNTAVMIMYFMLGERGLRKASSCDSRDVVKRHTEYLEKNSIQDKFASNKQVLAKMRRQIMRKSSKTRELYYILMNDSSFPYEGKMKPNAFFPGHVFVLEKIPGYPTPYYYIYQSYINKYDLKGHLKYKNNTLKMDYEETRKLLDKLKYILTQTKVWDDNCVQYWKDFTFVDTTNIKGSITEGNLFICCASSKVLSCMENIEQYAKTKLDQLQNVDEAQKHGTYGNVTRYHTNERILTNSEMRDRLTELLNDLRKYKKKL